MFITSINKDGEFCIYKDSVSDDTRVMTVLSLKEGMSAFELATNITDILNLQAPAYKMQTTGSVHYVMNDGDNHFTIRMLGQGFIGEQAAIFKSEIAPNYQELMQGRLKEDFFVALCDTMPAPAKPKVDNKQKLTP